ncbi:MAG: isochorismate synthase [Acidimicrobiales bacterium]
MRFRRTAVSPYDLGRLRARAARAGWLLEGRDVVRCGFADPVLTLELDAGLDDVQTAVDTLRAVTLVGDGGPPGTGVVAFASLPFAPGSPARLEVPRYVVTQLADGRAWLTRLEGSPDLEDLDDEPVDAQAVQQPAALTYQPTPDEYAHRVAQAVQRMRRQELDKVVLARAVLGVVGEPIDPAAIAHRLRDREPLCTVYALPLPDGRRYVGASPELLVRRTGALVQCHPLAGTIALPDDVDPEDYQDWLLGSAKNLHEHSILVQDIVDTLADAYDEVTADPTPSVVTLATIAHLGTWITAHTPDARRAPDALSILARLHPTAAVGGTPRDVALDHIDRVEADRGHYAGPLGWIDESGDGEWWIGIRGVVLDGPRFEARAGAGIIRESEPAAEREETRDKLASVLSAVISGV